MSLSFVLSNSIVLRALCSIVLRALRRITRWRALFAQHTCVQQLYNQDILGVGYMHVGPTYIRPTYMGHTPQCVLVCNYCAHKSCAKIIVLTR
jgi:hypothetical protein